MTFCLSCVLLVGRMKGVVCVQKFCEAALSAFLAPFFLFFPTVMTVAHDKIEYCGALLFLRIRFCPLGRKSLILLTKIEIQGLSEVDSSDFPFNICPSFVY